MRLKNDNLFCIICALIVFVFFSHTLNYPWKHFDEQIIYNETVYPIAQSFHQLIEIISNFGLNNHFEASNPFYSEISNLRSDPINTLITLVVYFFLKKNAFAYHILSLILHIFNTCLLFLILNKISSDYSTSSSKARLFIISILTLIWSLHPVNTESILFTANWSAVLSYSLCLIVINYFLSDKKNDALNFITLFILSLIPLLNTEYAVTLPVILFFYSYAKLRSIKKALIKCLPLFLSLGIFILHFISSPIKENIQSPLVNSTDLMLERIFWFSPQIFFHFIKLIILPLHLSIDQTAMVKLSDSLTGGYSIFCSVFMYLIIFLLAISFFFTRKEGFFYFFISLAPFFIALLPFLHLIAPTYCLASERYLYFPLAMLAFGISHTLFFVISKRATVKVAPTIIILVCILSILATRSYIRTYDWKDSVSLFSSALKEAPNDLFKAIRLEFLGSILNKKEYFDRAIVTLQNSLTKLEHEKQIHENTVPKIIKLYGLNPKTIQAKTAYFLAFTRFGILNDGEGAYNLLEPYMRDLSITDTQILDLYLGLLFGRNNLDEAERILNYTLQYRLSPTILIAASELHRLKYHDLSKAEYYLKKSFKYFPYDMQTLFYLKRFYLGTKNLNFAYYSYLYGLRTHAAQNK